MSDVKKYPPVVVVDENDHEIGLAMLSEVWQKGLYHRIASVYVQDDQGRFLLQFRGPDVKVYPNCWNQAAGGHVDAGQTYEQAALNELFEEIGVADVDLQELGTFRSNSKSDGRTINQFERVFIARVPTGTELKPGLSEVAALKWFQPDELKKAIAKNPEKFTDGLLQGPKNYFPAFQ